MVDRETLELLDKQGDSIVRRLSAYAVSRAGDYFWVKGIDALPGGGDPVDVAVETIEKLIRGEHTWNREKHPDVLDHLKSRVDSALYHKVYCAEHGMISGKDITELEMEAADIDDPEEQERMLHEEERARRCVEALDEAASRNAHLRDVLDGFREGLKPREIAEIMDIPRTEVYNLIRRLKRQARSILGLPPKD